MIYKNNIKICDILHGNSSLSVQSFSNDILPIQWVNRNALILVSMKNKHFTHSLIIQAAKLCLSYCNSLIISLVDKPYLGNIISDNYGKQLNVYHKIKSERATYLYRILKKEGLSKYFVSWNSLEHLVPTKLSLEFTSAVNKRGLVWECLKKQSSTIIDHETVNSNPEVWTRFLCQEIPVLIYLYYFTDKLAVDFYPGKQADFFWLLESLAFSEELPMISKNASGKHTIYVNLTTA